MTALLLKTNAWDAFVLMLEVFGAERMERIINVRVERLPEGVYLATSDDVQGLVAQGRTASEALELARDVARRLLEAQAERGAAPAPVAVADVFEYPLIVAD